MSLLRTIRIQSAKRFPVIGVYKRLYIALVHHLTRTKKTYAQHGEDGYIFELLRSIDISTGIYIDIGANHPTDISNTYLFYRAGFYGVTIEPNQELSQLHKKFRSKDITLSIGCGDRNEISKFSVSKTPVLSSFKKGTLSSVSIWKEVYVPIFRLDDALKDIPFRWIYLLSIDTEGLDFQVINGSLETLRKVYVLLVEISDQSDESKFDDLLEEHKFRKIKILGNNHIYLNSDISLSDFEK